MPGPLSSPADTNGELAAPRPLASCASTWSAAEVSTWVSEVLHLPQYAEIFEVQQIDGPTLLELPEELLDSELRITNPIHRKKIIAHVKLLGAYIETLTPSPSSSPVAARGRRSGQRGQTPRSASSTPACLAALRARAFDDSHAGGSDCEDFLSSGGAASLQSAGIASGARSNGGTGGIPGYSSSMASGSLLHRKDHSMVSSNFSSIPHGNYMADRAAARRGRSMDRLSILQQSQVSSRAGSRSNSARASQCGTMNSLQQSESMRSIGASSRNSTNLSVSQRRGRAPADGKIMTMNGKRVAALGELSPSCSRKGSFGKTRGSSPCEGSHAYSPNRDPLGPTSDSNPYTMYYKASFIRSPVTATISPACRKPYPQLDSESLRQSACSPGPGYRPKVDPLWSKVRVGGTIGGAQRFVYNRPNSTNWMNMSEMQED